MTSKSTMLIAVIIIIGGGIYFANERQKSEIQTTNDVAQAQSEKMVVKIQPAEISEAGFLDYDIIIGDKEAPVEIIEYAAITCPHCANFHADIYPQLKEKFLDTGRAKLVYRNFIFDNPFDVFAATLTRCVPEENFLPTVEAFFHDQRDWNKLSELKRIFESDGRNAAIKFAQGEVTRVGGQAGISTAGAQKCFDNKEVLNYLLKVRQEAVETYQVNSTPTVIVNGIKMGQGDIASLEKAIEAAEK